MSDAVSELERNLRKQGQILHHDIPKGLIWHFDIVRSHDEDVKSAEQRQEFPSNLFTVVENGSIDPANLHKGRNHPPVLLNAPPTPSSVISNADAHSRFAVAQKPQSPDHDGQLSKIPRSEARITSPPAAHETAYENFISAALLTATTQLASMDGAVMINYRTVLLDAYPKEHIQSREIPQPTLCTLRAYLTTAGSFILSVASTSCDGLAPSTQPQPTSASASSLLLTAPFGFRVAEYSREAGTVSTAQTPATQALTSRTGSDHQNPALRRACLKALQYRGINTSILDDCAWISVYLPRRANETVLSPCFPWPSPLCLRRRAALVLRSSRLDHDVLAGHHEKHDPLGQAKAWFNNSLEREEKVAALKAERNTVEVKDDAEARTFRPTKQAPELSTALGLGRAGASAASAMYPTPPDGIQQISGAQPSNDGHVSSPKDPPSAAAGLDVDTEMTAMATDGKSGETFNQDNWDAEDVVKRDRSDSNILGDADNVFGDMGGDMFGDNDITEADFNFFDEEPTPNGEDIDMPDVKPGNELPNISRTTSPPIDEQKAMAENEPVKSIPSPVFTKPELRHARSSLLEDTVIKPLAGASMPPAKRESSPFDPDTVFKRLRASLAAGAAQAPRKDQTTSISRRRSSVFERIAFDPGLPLINKKYEHGGSFDLDKFQGTTTSRPVHGILPETDYLRKRDRNNKKRKETPGSLLRRFTALETNHTQPLVSKNEEFISDDDDSTGESEPDDTSFTTEDPSSPVKVGLKKTKPDEESASRAVSVKEADLADDVEVSMSSDLPILSKPDNAEVLASRFFEDPEPVALDLSIPDEDLIQIAQILTEQAATGFLSVCSSVPQGDQAFQSHVRRGQLAIHARDAVRSIESAGIPFLKDATHATLKDVLDAQDAAVAGQPNRLQPRPIPGREPFNDMRASNFYSLPMPHLEVRRSESMLSVLSTAVMFWESLGLSPVSGAKSVMAACVFPNWAGVADNVGTFLSNMKSMYELLRLGTFEEVDLSEQTPGQLPFEVDCISTSPDATTTPNGSALIEAMEPLRKSVKEMTYSEKNLVLFFVYSPQYPASIIEACTAFQHFFDYYKKTVHSNPDVPLNELVLQLVSLDNVSSPTSLVVSRPNELIRQCIETYDRCTSFSTMMPAPAIMLEQPVPRHVNFECSPRASASLMHEHSCMHVAYAQSVDEQWVTAAWTDDRGRQQATASYCLGRKGKPLSLSMNEVAHEIWESTMELISTWKVQWRIVIAKCGTLDADEIRFWVDLARTQDKDRAKTSLTILSVESNPSLQLIPSVAKITQQATTMATTPASTPQPSVLSPDQVTTPATPARDGTGPAAGTPGTEATSEAEADSSLVDVTDQTWAALVGHRLGTAPSILELQPSLFSGYLIKRTGPSMDESPAVLEVNLVHSDHSPRQYEASMREVLSWYRALGTLARARGIVSKEADARPWHVAAAEKAVRALHLLL